MGNKVFANTREIACKAAAGKTICAFPDVCFTPPDKVPPTPPGIPIPYPNTGMASDTANGSKKVLISDKEIILKNKSYFKKSTGDEAGCAQKKGVITSKNTGKVFFQAWSMDVKIEGMNAARHLDITTNNHASSPGDTPPWSYLDGASKKAVDACEENRESEQKACGFDSENGEYLKSAEECCADTKCQESRKCMLVPYGRSGSPNCCTGQTGDHIVEASSFATKRTGGVALKGCKKYDLKKAPTCCVKGGAYSANHGKMSCLRGYFARKCSVTSLRLSNGSLLKGKRGTTYGEAKKNAAKALKKIFPHCSEDCILMQFETFDKRAGLKDSTEVRAITYGDPQKWVGRLWSKTATESMSFLKKFSSGGASF